jgi:hypothetical protein
MERVARLWQATWHRALRRLFGARRTLRTGPSAIQGTGVFTTRAFASGEEIGPVGLGAPGGQTRHSLQVGEKHRDVKKPWRYMNHSCKPTGRLVMTANTATLFATRALPVGTELTIDYNELPERVSARFRCRCASCQEGATATQFGA